MAIRYVFALIFIVTACGLFAGCGKTSTAVTSDASEEDSLLADILGDIDLTETGPPTDQIETGNKAEPAEPVPSLTIPMQQETLALRLSEGDRFPLIKTVEQTLVQKSQQFPATAETSLKLFMDISVDQVRTDAVLLSVVYKRVQYAHDLNGQQFHFDTDTNTAALPDDLVPYSGMINNGFSFWIGTDNKVREVVGYQNFLQQCVAQVPAVRQLQLLNQIAARFGEHNGVADFIDDSIGLLPYNSAAAGGTATNVAEGDEWIRERHLDQPVPLQLQSTCRLVSLSDATAEIDIAGRITADSSSQQVASDGTNVQITGGRIVGSCTVDRGTGLPLNLTRSQYLNLTVTLPTGQTVQQDKQIKTTIQTKPNARRPVVQASPLRQVPPPTFQTTVRPRRTAQPDSSAFNAEGSSSASRAIQTVSGIPGRDRATSIPTDAPPRVLSSTATAAYPD